MGGLVMNGLACTRVTFLSVLSAVTAVGANVCCHLNRNQCQSHHVQLVLQELTVLLTLTNALRDHVSMTPLAWMESTRIDVHVALAGLG